MCGRICVCAGVRKCAEIRKPAQFLHLRVFFLCGLSADIVRKTLSRVHVGARNAISCAQGAENAFPAFSERMTQAGTLNSRLVPACLLFIDRDGKTEMRMQVMRYVHVRETNHGDFKELGDIYQATRKDSPDKRPPPPPNHTPALPPAQPARPVPPPSPIHISEPTRPY